MAAPPKQKIVKPDLEKEKQSLLNDRKRLIFKIEEYQKTIAQLKEEISAYNDNISKRKAESERQEAIVSAYEREIDLLRTIKAEHEKQLGDKARTIRDLNQTIEGLQKGKEASTVEMDKLKEEIQQLKLEIDRINNMSVFKRIIGKK